jgi:hypothetical protein
VSSLASERIGCATHTTTWSAPIGSGTDLLGRVDDVALSHDGSVSYAVIAHGGFLGIGENSVAVPFDRLIESVLKRLRHEDVAADFDQRGEGQRSGRRCSFSGLDSMPFASRRSRVAMPLRTGREPRMKAKPE